ncbi:L,D-transpeptidase [Bradyrhizobium prioriisuperbiae]|uniref:L,D-transpeptidase n=1 Tax=Bradyrhizobium prioriisuperbiae TaxID=2854389 RepID=UPI0028E5A7E7|nr:L,D-transpeptidase family protein [Bradyrhizobium prioritasuperba]
MTPSICRRTDVRRVSGAVAVILATAFLSTGASAQALGYANDPRSQGFWTDGGLPSAQQPMTDDNGSDAYVVPQRLQRQTVSYATHEAAGTIVIDTANTVLYYVLGNNRAIRYGVGVGREGFTWSGTQNITRKAEWPDWHPPTEMIARQPYLPRFMAGGPGNPLGARAMYLGSSVYRIHGTNDPSTIGKFVSSGCIRLTNPDVEDLFSRVNVGTRVVVLPKSGAPRFEAHATVPARAAAMVPAQPMPVRTAFQRQVNQTTAGLY